MMNGVIVSKLQSLEETLGELRSLGEITTEQLTREWRTRRAVERDLQVLVEVVIDVCQRILALLNQTPAATSADAVNRCIEAGILSESESYRKMVQFRNFVVHRYERIDVGILVDIVNNRLADFERFRDEVLSYARSAD
ncbi:MAG: DUF86 domain-containing protein [Lentisphaerae bacterium]|nr:DUF86 domain-containing protein [Lentisphaerota bacterium]